MFGEILDKIERLEKAQQEMFSTMSSVVASMEKISSQFDEEKETRGLVSQNVLDTLNKTIECVKESGARKSASKSGKSTATGARKFPTNSITWFKEQYLEDPEFKKKYFSEKALANAEETLPETEKKKLGAARQVAEAAHLYKTKVTPDIKAKITEDWRAAKEEFEKSSRTPANEDKSESQEEDEPSASEKRKKRD